MLVPELIFGSREASPQPANESETLASRVYRRLENDVLRGQLKPGAKLVTGAVEKYRVGKTPLREALNRLADHGLVVRADNKGFRVSPASAEELLEIIRTRCWLEEIALRESIRHGDNYWAERVLLAYYRLSRTPRPEGESLLYDWPEWERRHREFHLALLSACNSSTLIGYCADLQARTFRYRKLASVRAYRSSLQVDEHRAIHEAALERDADRAVELLTAHYRETGVVVASSETFADTTVASDFRTLMLVEA